MSLKIPALHCVEPCSTQRNNCFVHSNRTASAIEFDPWIGRCYHGGKYQLLAMKVPNFLLLSGLAGTICSIHSLGTNMILLSWLSVAIAVTQALVAEKLLAYSVLYCYRTSPE